MGFNGFETSLLARAIRELEERYRIVNPHFNGRFYLGLADPQFMMLKDGRLTVIEMICHETRNPLPYDFNRLPPADYLNLIRSGETEHECFQRIKAAGHNTYNI